MGEINKVLCKLEKAEIRAMSAEICIQVSDPKFCCRKCVRVSSSKKLLCKPQKLKHMTSKQKKDRKPVSP